MAVSVRDIVLRDLGLVAPIVTGVGAIGILIVVLIQVVVAPSFPLIGVLETLLFASIASQASIWLGYRILNSHSLWPRVTMAVWAAINAVVPDLLYRNIFPQIVLALTMVCALRALRYRPRRSVPDYR